MSTSTRKPHQLGGFVIQRRSAYGRNITTLIRKPTRVHQADQELMLSHGSHRKTRKFKDLGLQGLTEACDSELPFLNRFLWGSLWLVLLACCVTQCVMSLNQFISCPTNVNIRYQKQKIIAPPCVTLCPMDDMLRYPAVWPPLLKKQFGDISYHSTPELLKIANMNISTLWSISTFMFDNFAYEIEAVDTSYITKAEPWVEVKELNTIYGTCLTVKSLIELPCTGKEAYLYISAIGESPNTTFNDFSYILHSEAQIPLLRYYGPTINGVFPTFNRLITSVIQLTEETHVDSWNRPCISEADYFHCKADCTEKMIRSKSRLKEPCRLPFMKDDGILQLCNSADELEEMMRAAKEATEEFAEDESECGCHQPCRKIVYKEDYIIVEPRPKELFELSISFPKCHYQEIKEEFSYQTTHLLSDIGGALGLYMGMSILSIVAILETVISKLCRARMPVNGL